MALWTFRGAGGRRWFGWTVAASTCWSCKSWAVEPKRPRDGAPDERLAGGAAGDPADRRQRVLRRSGILADFGPPRPPRGVGGAGQGESRRGDPRQRATFVHAGRGAAGSDGRLAARSE